MFEFLIGEGYQFEFEAIMSFGWGIILWPFPPITNVASLKQKLPFIANTIQSRKAGFNF